MARLPPNARSNEFSPAWRQIVTEIGGTGLLGTELRNRIENVFQRNQITPAAALQELQPILQALTTFKNGLTEVTNGLTHLKIGAEELAPGECEVGVAIPREAIDDEFKTFTDELEEFEFIFATFLELSTGHRDPLPIRTLSSTALMVYVGMAQAAAAAFAYAAERITLAYKNLLEAREIKARLQALEMPANHIEQFERLLNERMAHTVEQVSIEVEQKFFRVDDDLRRQELKNAVRVSLRGLANRIDKGYNIDVRIGPPTDEQKADAETAAAIRTIEAASVSLQFMRLGGEPILMLDEGERAKGEEATEAKRPKKKTK